MNKDIEELKESNKDDFFEGLGLQIFIGYYIIPILIGFEKRLKKIEDKQNRKISGPIITKIISQEEEEKNIKIGGTDPE